MAYIPPPEETSRPDSVRKKNRAMYVPQAGDLAPPFATKYFNNQSPGVGEPPPKKFHPQHSRVYFEHHRAFPNPVGIGTADHRMDLSEEQIIRDHEGRPVKRLGHRATEREMREKAMIMARLSEAKALTPKERAIQQAAIDLTEKSELDAKRLFKNFDRNEDGTISFTSFANGLRLAGVKADPGLQREMFEDASQGARHMPYVKFVNDMKLKAARTNNKTSLDIDDPEELHRERLENNQRKKLRKLGFLQSPPAENDRAGQSISKWKTMSAEERRSALLRERVMLKLQEKEEHVEAAFVSVDSHRDGKLNKTEFQEGIKRLGINLSNEDAGTLFDGLPRTPNGLLDYNGFSKFLRERSVNQHYVGQVRATNFSHGDAIAHVVQQRVADAVASKRKDLEIVFKEKDQGRGPPLRSQMSTGDGFINLAQLDDALKSVGVILSSADTQRLFDRVDVENEGKIKYKDFMKFTCGQLAVDLGETTEEHERRVRKLRAWNSIAGDPSDGRLQDTDGILIHGGSANRVEQNSGQFPISVSNPANKLTQKERADLVTQQRIVDLYAKNRKQMNDVLQFHRDKPINLAEFMRCSKIAGIQIAAGDAERLFRSIDINQSGTIDSVRLVEALDAHATKNFAEHSIFSAPGDEIKSEVPEGTFYNGGLTRHADSGARAAADNAVRRRDSGTAGLVPHEAMDRFTVTATNVGRADLSSRNLQSAPVSSATEKWFLGDTQMRLERLATVKLMRRIQEAATPAKGTNVLSRGLRHSSGALEDAFRSVPAVRERGDGFVTLDDFVKGVSSLGVQISSSDARRIFSHFGADQNDAINMHSFIARVHDQNRMLDIDRSEGLHFRSEVNSDPNVLLDSSGVPSRSKAYYNKLHSRERGIIRGGYHSNRTNSSRVQVEDMRRRLRLISPRDPESCRKYLLHVFEKFDPEGASGKISRRNFRNAMLNFERELADDSKLAPVMQYLDQSYSGDIDYRRFVESVLAVTGDERHYGVEEQYAMRQHAVKKRIASKHKEKSRIDWNKHRWQSFKNKWVEQHGAPAAKEMRIDASITPSGGTWSSAPENKQPFRIYHPTMPSPISKTR